MWYGTFCPNNENDHFRANSLKFIQEIALITKEKDLLHAFMVILSEFTHISRS